MVHRPIPEVVNMGLEAILELIPGYDDDDESEVRIWLAAAHTAGRREAERQYMVAIDALKSEVLKLRSLHDAPTRLFKAEE